MTDGADPTLPDATRFLLDELARVEANSALPRMVVLYGETGRGKTYAVQRFYDELCRLRPGHWAAGLTPQWPPHSTSAVNYGRKRIMGRVDPAADGMVPFFWLGVESYAYGRDPTDPVPSAGQQLHEMFRSALTRSEKQKKITLQVFKAGIDIIGALVAPIGVGKAIVDNAAAAWSLSRSADELEEQRQAVHKGFAAAARACGGKAPMIVVVDDAQDVDAETLYLLSGLIAPSAELGDDADTGYLPHRLDHTMPAPVLVICTAWEHRVVGAAYRQPFQVWLDELDALSVTVTYTQCGEFDLTAAGSVLRNWGDVPDNVRDELLEHVSYTVGQRVSINPLVLNLGVARLEERRDPFSGQLDASAAEIAALPVTPEAHIRDRLDRVRAEELGDLAIGILELCSALGGYSAPLRFFEFATGPAGAERLAGALALLDRHELAVPAWSDETRGQGYQLRTYRFDVDVLRYLSGEPPAAGQAERLVRMSTQFLEWTYFELLRTDFSTEMLADTIIDSICVPMANVVLVQPGNDPASDAVSIARVLTKAGAPDPDAASVRALGFAFARGAIGRLPDDVLLSAFADLWPSRVALRIAERRLTDGASDLDAPVEAQLLDALRAHSTVSGVAIVVARVYQCHRRHTEAIELVQTHVTDPVVAAMIQAECYDRLRQGDLAIAALECHDSEGVVLKRAKLMAKYGRKVDAVRELAGIVAVSEGAAIALAWLLEHDDPDRAAQALEPYAVSSAAARAILAQLISRSDPDRALTLLADDPTESSVALAAKLHEAAGRHDEAMRLMSVGAERSSNIAIRYAQALIEAGDELAAINVLRGHAETASNAATMLAELLEKRYDIPGAIDVLRPVADRFRNAATRLAGYLQRNEPEEAVRLLSLWADNSDGYRLLVMSLLRCGRPDDALEILDGRLRLAQDRRARTLRTSAYFLSGDLVSARATFALLDRNPRIGEYYGFAALFAGQGQVDLMVELLGGQLPQRDRVVADFTLSAAVHAGGGPRKLGECCHQLWPPGKRRSDVRHKLIGSLWSWTRDQDSVVPDMNTKKALSCLEVVAATGGVRPELRAAIHDALVTNSHGDPKTAPMLAFFANVSDVARGVLEELDATEPRSAVLS